jgi:hypothetical protein
MSRRAYMMNGWKLTRQKKASYKAFCTEKLAEIPVIKHLMTRENIQNLEQRKLEEIQRFAPARHPQKIPNPNSQTPPC